MELLQELKLQGSNDTETGLTPEFSRLFRWLLWFRNWLFCCRGGREELSADVSLAP